MKILSAYIIVTIFLAYVLYHQLQVVKLISTKTDLKLRSKVVEKQKQLRLYIKLCPVWPALILKEIYDEFKQRRQS